MCGCARSPQNGETTVAIIEFDYLEFIDVFDSVAFVFARRDRNHVVADGNNAEVGTVLIGVIVYFQAQLPRGLGLRRLTRRRGCHRDNGYLGWKDRGSVGW